MDEVSGLIPALLPAQLKLFTSSRSVQLILWAHSGFIAGSIETIPFCHPFLMPFARLIPALLPAQLKRLCLLFSVTDPGRLIPALLPAQLKQPLSGEPAKGNKEAHSGFIAGSIETFPAQPPFCCFRLAHSGFIAGSIETALLNSLLLLCIRLIPALLPAQLKRQC